MRYGIRVVEIPSRVRPGWRQILAEAIRLGQEGKGLELTTKGDVTLRQVRWGIRAHLDRRPHLRSLWSLHIARGDAEGKRILVWVTPRRAGATDELEVHEQ